MRCLEIALNLTSSSLCPNGKSALTYLPLMVRTYRNLSFSEVSYVTAQVKPILNY